MGAQSTYHDKSTIALARSVDRIVGPSMEPSGCSHLIE
jgi:hypothetical protein